MARNSRPRLRALPTPPVEPELGLWYVRVTFGGGAVAEDDLTPALQRFSEANPLATSIRYAESCAEVSYWDEAPNAEDAAAMALRVWNEHRTDLGLPDWEVVSLEVYDRDRWEEIGDPQRGLTLTASLSRFRTRPH